MPAERPISFDLATELKGYSKEQDKLKENISFLQYHEKVAENPSLVRPAHKYLYDAVTAYPDLYKEGKYALYGVDESVDNYIAWLRDGAKGGTAKNRIRLQMGPKGSGKSTLFNGSKAALEQYSRTDAGAAYAIADCPMNEEPLHLIPADLRSAYEKRYGAHIEGELCPHCNHKYGNKSFDDLLSDDPKVGVRVKRLIFSEKDRVGIGTFKPSDPKSQDMTELIGSVDFSKLAEYGTTSDPRAYRFDGELNIANRGLMEFVELLKSDEQFHYALLDLAQDRVIKAPRFANIYADEVLGAHTNPAEYAVYISNPKNEALQDRISLGISKYTLKASEERNIYDKLLQSNKDIASGKIHINPHTLDIASNFAILSRLMDSKKAGMTRMKKLKIYDGSTTGDLTQRDLRELQEEFKDEGMSGISPRYVSDTLSGMITRDDDRVCATPIDVLRALRDNLDNHTHTRDMKPEDKEKIRSNIGAVKIEYDEIVKRDVQSAFIYSYEDTAASLVGNYLTNVDSFCNNRSIVDPVTHDETPPDERIMRSIEEQIGITENAKAEFRKELMQRIGSAALQGEVFDYHQHPRLREAVEKKLFTDLKDVVKMTTSAKVPNAEQQRRIGEVQQRLVEEKGYCSHCADETVRYAGTLLAK